MVGPLTGSRAAEGSGRRPRPNAIRARGGGRPLGRECGEQDVGPLQQGPKRLRPCFRALNSALSNTGKSFVLSSGRNPLEIFGHTFPIRMSCSAEPFAKGLDDQVERAPPIIRNAAAATHVCGPATRSRAVHPRAATRFASGTWAVTCDLRREVPSPFPDYPRDSANVMRRKGGQAGGSCCRTAAGSRETVRPARPAQRVGASLRVGIASRERPQTYGGLQERHAVTLRPLAHCLTGGQGPIQTYSQERGSRCHLPPPPSVRQAKLR